ncbi:MAG: type IX secretion system membrane protein PorP/SprF [Bacteroidetes bacterium]|nr:type IX secretion system membrane protein PorP/SprF [Bacteroidota bacterium]
MNRLLVLCIFLFAGSYLYGQQLSLFTQYREHTSIINPAAINGDYFAFEQNLSFGASYRAQWVGLANPPTTQTVRGEYFMNEGNSVNLLLGGHIINDQTGPTGFTGIYGRIGGVLSEDPEYAGLSVGMNIGLVQYRVKVEEIRLREQNDILGSDDQMQLFPDVGLGVYGYRMLESGFFNGDYLYGGVSIPQVMGLDLTFQNEDGEFYTKRIQHFYGMLGLYKFLRDDSFLEPSIWVKYAPNTPVSLDFNLRYQMVDNFWVGTGISLSKTFHVEAGFILGENLGLDNTIKLGYGFDYSFSSFGPAAGSTHELNLSVSLYR